MRPPPRHRFGQRLPGGCYGKVPSPTAIDLRAVDEFLMGSRDASPIARELELGNASRSFLPRKASR